MPNRSAQTWVAERIGLVSLVEDDIRDEKRTDHKLRLAARVVRPNYS